MNALSSHISAATLSGQLIGGRINGVQRTRGKSKRTGMQGAAGTNTGSGQSNKALLGNATVGFKARKTSTAHPVLKAGMPKVAAPSLGKPKSKFVLAFEKAKQMIEISTNSKAAAAGAKATKSPTASSPGAGID